jgi:hypothetical protein
LRYDLTSGHAFLLEEERVMSKNLLRKLAVEIGNMIVHWR